MSAQQVYFFVFDAKWYAAGMEKIKVVYDDGCPTCAVGKNMAEKLDADHRINFIGMNTEEGKRLIHEHHLDMHESAYAIHQDGVSAKSDMVRRVLAHNGIMGALLSIPFRIPWLSDKLYDLLVLHRNHVTKTRVE